jgi:hypothetical protein
MGRESRPAPFEMTGVGALHNCSYIYIATGPDLYFAATRTEARKGCRGYGENREEGSF